MKYIELNVKAAILPQEDEAMLWWSPIRRQNKGRRPDYRKSVTYLTQGDKVQSMQEVPRVSFYFCICGGSYRRCIGHGML